MLFIGIDEAGYGPLIGPLCHGYAAFRIENYSESLPPDLWKLLRPAVSRTGKRGVAICDSKALYSGEKGFSKLEFGVRACLECARGEQSAVFGLSALLPADDFADLALDPWWHVPGEYEAAPPCLKTRVSFPKALARVDVAILAVGARAMSARTYNARLEKRGANKADVNWSVAAAELKRLAKLARPGEAIVAFIDRQGGRKFYAALVCEVFECALAQIEHEEPKLSIYKLESNGRCIRVGFFVDGETCHLPIALASMSAKLARELVMLRLNAFFKQHLPELKRTAGYYGDAQRFLRETKTLRKQLAIKDADFIRVK